jgi:hypothetical protein
MGFMREVGVTTARVLLMGALNTGHLGVLECAVWCFSTRKTYPALMFMALHAIAQAKDEGRSSFRPWVWPREEHQLS